MRILTILLCLLMVLPAAAQDKLTPEQKIEFYKKDIKLLEEIVEIKEQILAKKDEIIQSQNKLIQLKQEHINNITKAFDDYLKLIQLYDPDFPGIKDMIATVEKVSRENKKANSN